MFGIKSLVAVAALCISFAQAQLTISEPSSAIWWVAQSQNTLRWSCNTSPYTNWTVLITNSNTAILSGPLALIAIGEYNYDCSKTIIPGEQLVAGTGYVMQFANPFNNTDVFASSESFEVKPLGSTYPQITTSEGLTATGGSSATGTSRPTTTSTPGSNGAMANAVGVASLTLAGIGAVFFAL